MVVENTSQISDGSIAMELKIVASLLQAQENICLKMVRVQNWGKISSVLL